MYYRQNVVYYGKLYGDGKRFIQRYEMMELTEKAEKLVKTVKELWTEKDENLAELLETDTSNSPAFL